MNSPENGFTWRSQPAFVLVAAGATLGGVADIDGDVTNSGTVAPGASRNIMIP